MKRQENIIYLVVWGLLFASPLLSLYVRTISDSDVTFDWAEIFIVWRMFAVYLVFFLVHNFLIAPLLVQWHRRAAYFSIVAVVIAAFTVYQCSSRPTLPKDPPKTTSRQPMHINEDFDRPMPHRAPPPPPIVGEHDILAIAVLILMFGANLGIKIWFRSRDDRRRLEQLERENLEQQLEYLRYQINPHFFMNTLNNIHALVEIDPAKAQETILELSKMMRFVLYEGNKQGVPLSKEMEFIRTYVKLMQLRYTDKVRITLNLPQAMPEAQIPPLLLITFIENAFKHGVSYRHESFIEVQVQVEAESLCFLCRNSKASAGKEEKGGVGLANVRKRLDLLYQHDYALHISDNAEV